MLSQFVCCRRVVCEFFVFIFVVYFHFVACDATLVRYYLFGGPHKTLVFVCARERSCRQRRCHDTDQHTVRLCDTTRKRVCVWLSTWSVHKAHVAAAVCVRRRKSWNVLEPTNERVVVMQYVDGACMFFSVCSRVTCFWMCTRLVAESEKQNKAAMCLFILFTVFCLLLAHSAPLLSWCGMHVWRWPVWYLLHAVCMHGLERTWRRYNIS